jgi:hypothetical protein
VASYFVTEGFHVRVEALLLCRIKTLEDFVSPRRVKLLELALHVAITALCVHSLAKETARLCKLQSFGLRLIFTEIRVQLCHWVAVRLLLLLLVIIFIFILKNFTRLILRWSLCDCGAGLNRVWLAI